VLGVFFMPQIFITFAFSLGLSMPFRHNGINLFNMIFRYEQQSFTVIEIAF
jgi:hypothetical protein